MSQDPNYLIDVSRKLSEVLSDVGVNERILQKRRRMVLLQETMEATQYRLLGQPTSIYHFGSQSEGSTTIQLNSDTDVLICDNRYNVIQAWSEWQPGMINLLMIQDETTSSGYCLLQRLRDDEPLPVPPCFTLLPEQLYTRDKEGRVLLKSSYLNANILNTFTPIIKHGPASSSEGLLGFADQDCVPAYNCKTWPAEAQPWLVRQSVGGWPTEEIKRYCETTGCFVVPVSSKSGRNEELEWRISTSLAERCLMLSLNITQMRCYILMKMILKTLINPQCNGVLSSFMCKTVLFHCIQNTHSNEWQEHTLLTSLKCCLIKLQSCVEHTLCPHFIIPGNNLMGERISVPVKQKLLEILQRIIKSDGSAIMEIPIDDLGLRFRKKMNMLPVYLDIQQNISAASVVSEELMLNTGRQVCICLNYLILFGTNPLVEMPKFLLILLKTYSRATPNTLTKAACRLLIPPLCSTLGSMIASQDISINNTTSLVAQTLLCTGVNSDVLSGRLKLASAFYCSGNMEGAEFVLRNAEDTYDQNTAEHVCCCREYGIIPIIKSEFLQKCNAGNEEVIKHIVAFCVRFIPSEINCVPQELQYEMFKSTQEDMLRTRLQPELTDCRADWAQVDSLPYLYFLQYKTYGHLQRPDGQQCALEYLTKTTDTEPNLGHRETALNLLGQCMEQENRHTDALRCYVRSLNIRPRNNAAKIHICRLLNELVNRPVETSQYLR
ncbi:uncharacterized protein LOC123550101 [Mercenaria mercenaria]|uniref:uncharacterized protein LOC123550101 n=1 Tax=Mercenaria mercenaria TaxID=6596 RepID=UPI00234E4A27|nr:uncharacterized protein LOC123550101 [Mercenaria mercenaria]